MTEHVDNAIRSEAVTGPGWIDADDWATIVASVPIVSIDLVVKTGAGVVLARRTNEPASGEWFVPGGRVRKGERLQEAVHRVAEEELDADVTIEASLGAYQHFYRTADVEDAGGKHYLANGFVVRTDSETFALDDQHDAVDIFETPPDDLHPYTAQYLADTGVL
ncbi:NUDIX domain-containing protein [Halorhabdus rudnickae]|uniref:NUDIX domain-containing protein n=1 Tax=Halorhabdus rudnickae TaxID=1775544 RepID=UPI001082C4E3|nr:NUDIX domain-containing protein [Halorhabdus rudnickae]